MVILKAIHIIYTAATKGFAKRFILMFALPKNKYRVKGSTLMETLVATILIIVIFMLASMIMNNLFSNTIKSNTRAIDTRISELNYLYTNDKLDLPYQTNYKDWSIDVYKFKNGKDTGILFEAFNTKTKRTITQQLFETK